MIQTHYLPVYEPDPYHPKIMEFIGLIKESIGIWLHLHGEPPKAISPDSLTKNNFQIENQNGQSIYASGNVVNIITNMEAGEAVEKFIKSALEKDLSHVEINSKFVGKVAKIEKKEAAYFIPIITEKLSEVKNEQEIQMALLIESAVFKEGNKWRFSDGEHSFPATIIDEEFIKRVNEGSARFGKGDELVARVRFTQSGTFGSLKLDRTIIKVLEHKIPPRTGRLFTFDPSEK